jgi:hypothetical protein
MSTSGLSSKHTFGRRSIGHSKSCLSHGDPIYATMIDIDVPRQTHPVTKAIDPEALPGIEMAAARDLRVSQKLDDPYLVCFDEPYDAEKYAKH